MLVAALGAPTIAHAQTDADGVALDGTDQTALFKRGQELYRAGEYEQSYQVYKRAWELQKGYDIAGNLGNVEVKLGKYAAAVTHLQYVLDHLPPSIDADKRAKIIAKTKERLAKAKSHVAIVDLAISPDGATIVVDGAALGTAPLSEPLVLDPGAHEIVVTLEGHDDVSHSIEATAGTQETLRIQMVALGAGGSAGIESSTNEADDGPNLVIVIAGGVLGLGAIGAGIGLHVAASGNASDADDIRSALGNDSACNGASPPAQCGELSDRVDQEATLGAAGTGLLIGGGVIVAATVAYALWPRGEDSDEDTTSWLVPQVGPSHAGLSVVGRF